jgi:hypothetical protein
MLERWRVESSGRNGFVVGNHGFREATSTYSFVDVGEVAERLMALVLKTHLSKTTNRTKTILPTVNHPN